VKCTSLSSPKTKKADTSALCRSHQLESGFGIAVEELLFLDHYSTPQFYLQDKRYDSSCKITAQAWPCGACFAGLSKWMEKFFRKLLDFIMVTC
jgi:hypothetical protein